MSVIAEPHAIAAAPSSTSRWHIDVVGTVDAAAPVWAMLESDDRGSAYQSRRFLGPWIEQVAPTLGVEPRFGLVRDASGAPVALLPFGVRQRGPVRTVIYLGGRDANLNGPLLRANVAIDEAEARDLLRLFARRMMPRPDLFVLANQPRECGGVRNPFVLSESSPSPSAAFGGLLPSDPETLLRTLGSKDARKKLRSKETRLAAMGAVIFERVDRSRAAETVATLIAQKQVRFAARGIDTGLGSEGALTFLREVAAPPTGEPVLDLYTLRVGEIVVATYAGFPHGRHWHGFVNSFTGDAEIARCSPGDLLLRRVLADLVRRGFTRFDLGIGEARYKTAVCSETIALYDTIVPVTALGHAVAAAEAARRSAKRLIKQTPWALALVRRGQAALAKRQDQDRT